MRLNFIKPLLANLALMLILTPVALALEIPDIPDAKDGVVSIKTVEPERRVGYTVGDIITRTVYLKINKPYQLIEESLPIVGYEKRYKGQVIGIELHEISHAKEAHDHYTEHKIKLSYQVFTNSVVAKPAVLPAEYLRLINLNSPNIKGSKEIVRYRIPSYEIAVSPLSIFGQVKIEADMSGFRGPLLVSAYREKQQLKIAVVVLGLSLIGLLYILGKSAWLPRMGGPFAKAYRAVRKMPHTENGLQQAVSLTHQALNLSAGQSIFTHNLDEYLNKKPVFLSIKPELEQFFGLSRQVFFEPCAAHSVGADPMKWLISFCRHCRDCERGLSAKLAKPSVMKA